MKALIAIKLWKLYSVKKLYLTTTNVARGLPDSNCEWMQSECQQYKLYWKKRWMKWLIIRHLVKDYPLIWTHHETGLFIQVLLSLVFHERLTCLAMGSGESWCTETVIAAQSYPVNTHGSIHTRVACTFIRICVIEIDIALEIDVKINDDSPNIRSATHHGNSKVI